MPATLSREDVFVNHVALARLFPAVTLKAAAAEARAMGCTIRRESDWGQLVRGWEVYPAGAPDSGLWAASPAEALYLARCFAADAKANRLSLFASLTLKARAEVVAAAACRAAGIDESCVVASVRPLSPELGESRVTITFDGADGFRTEAAVNPRDPDDMAARMAAAAEAVADNVVARTLAAEAAARDADSAERQQLVRAIRAAGGEAWRAQAGVAPFFSLGTADLRDIAAQLGQLPAQSPQRAPRSLSAAATPPSLRGGYTGHDGAPARVPAPKLSRVAVAAAMARDAAELGQLARGSFPLWAVASERAARAIDESLSLGLYSDDDSSWGDVVAELGHSFRGAV